MLDIALIRKDPEGVRQRLSLRGKGAADGLAKVLEADEERRKLIGEVEKLKAERNTISKEIGARKGKGQQADDLMAGMKEKSDRIAELDRLTAEVEARQESMLLTLPNLPWEECPKGAGEVWRFGAPRRMPFREWFSPLTSPRLWRGAAGSGRVW